MESNTQKKRPDWLTDEVVAEMKQAIKECDNPYTTSDEIPFDGFELGGEYSELEWKRYIAFRYIKLLTIYNLL